MESTHVTRCTATLVLRDSLVLVSAYLGFGVSLIAVKSIRPKDFLFMCTVNTYNFSGKVGVTWNAS